MSKHEKLVDEGSMVFPYLLVITGIILSALAIAESYFQMTKSEFTILGFLHDVGLLENYKISLKPNRGIWHPIAWTGSAFFCLMMLYSVRKHFKFMYGLGSLRHWLNVHMWLGIVATVFVTTHTTYKVGGLVSISFWSMILVASSGVLGRYIYLQIPRGISGNELKQDEVEEIMAEITDELEKFVGSDPKILTYSKLIAGPANASETGVLKAIFTMIANDYTNFQKMSFIKKQMKKNSDIPPATRKRLMKLIREQGGLVRSNNFLTVSHRLLHYWHVFHKPFAVIMFIIMFLHIGIYYLFRVDA